MNLQAAIELARSQNRRIARTSDLATSGDSSYTSVDNLRVSVLDMMATDWQVEPIREVTLNMETLIRKWNEALPSGTLEANKAPVSDRFKRFATSIGFNL